MGEGLPSPLSLMRNTFYIQQAEVYNKFVLIAQIKNENSCCQAIESAGLLCNIGKVKNEEVLFRTTFSFFCFIEEFKINTGEMYENKTFKLCRLLWK